MVNVLLAPIYLHQHHFKATKLIADSGKSNWLGRHIEWLKEDCGGWKKIFLVALAILEKQILMATVVGWVVLYQTMREEKKQKARAAFFDQAQHAIPPSDTRIEIPSKTHAFNHAQEFIIKDDIIWTRLRHYSTWTPIYFDGFAEGRIPKEIDCDGANLVVLDDLGEFHYKKVLREFRITEIKNQRRKQLAQADIDFSQDTYVAINKSARDNWKDKWFSLPYISFIVNLFTKKRLQLVPGATAWAISHRGRYNNYLEDKAQQPHFVGVGTTTLYVLHPKRKDVYKFDPWSPKHANIIIPLPETSKMTFEAEDHIDASASTIIVIGYETHKDNPKKQRLQIYTSLADIDSEGWNPGFKYSYFKHSTDPDVIVIPLPRWQSHPIQLAPGDFITKNACILQCGEGNHSRYLRVPGQCQGEKGFYFKKIDELDWRFEPLEDELIEEISEDDALPIEKDNLEKFQTTVHNYDGKLTQLPGFRTQKVSSHLTNFGQRSYHSQLILKVNQMQYELELHKRKTLRNFLGFEGDYYEIVVPEIWHHDKQLMQALKGQKVIPVQVTENSFDVIIEDQKKQYFKFVFARQN